MNREVCNLDEAQEPGHIRSSMKSIVVSVSLDGSLTITTKHFKIAGVLDNNHVSITKIRISENQSIELKRPNRRASQFHSRFELVCPRRHDETSTRPGLDTLDECLRKSWSNISI